jgi:mono/diheme cytochrome c family protein
VRFITVIAVLVIAVAIAGGVYFFAGFYDVTASAAGNPVVEWAVAQVREASIENHAHAPSPPSWLNDPATIKAGAHEFTEEGCVNCHGAPGVKPDKFAQGMNPSPPDFTKHEHDEAGEFFYIVKNGIRMTGMPAFGGHASDDEIWRAVAFVMHMSKVSPADYKAWRGESDAHEDEKKQSERGVGAPAPLESQPR